MFPEKNWEGLAEQFFCCGESAGDGDRLLGERARSVRVPEGFMATIIGKLPYGRKEGTPTRFVLYGHSAELEATTRDWTFRAERVVVECYVDSNSRLERTFF